MQGTSPNAPFVVTLTFASQRRDSPRGRRPAAPRRDGAHRAARGLLRLEPMMESGTL